jgi:ribose transport system ATP-binding protein
VIGMSDRIIVMRQGEIAGEVSAGASEAEIMFLATGERDIAVDGPGGAGTEEGR